MSDNAVTIHVVDDDAAVRRALKRLLGASGFNVEVWETGTQFLERMPQSFTAGCILLDVNMPGLSGIELQERLCTRHLNEDILPIIFLTGHGDIRMSVRAIKAGAEDFLSKPVDKAALLDAIGRALERSRRACARLGHAQALAQRYAQLTVREKEVFRHLLLGKLNKQIAFELGNSERTVKAHRRSIMEKLHVKSVAELVVVATELGLSPMNVTSAPKS